MLSRIVGHLESAKLVARAPDQSDARVVHLSATEAGRSLWEEIRNERTDALLYALSQLPDEQRRSIEQALPALEKLVETLRNREQ
jgi:DNA-binding MarR family transcriptional regulator